MTIHTFNSSKEANDYLIRNFPREELTIHPTVIVYDCVTIEDNVGIGPYAVVGKSGFGYDDTGKIPHVAGVHLCSGVEIGAHTCIDKGKLQDTYIGENTKIDNLVHIGHNARIGKNCKIVAGAVIGGSCQIGDNVFVGMNVSIRQHIKIGNNVIIGAGSVVVTDVPDGLTVVGVPAKPLKTASL